MSWAHATLSCVHLRHSTSKARSSKLSQPGPTRFEAGVSSALVSQRHAHKVRAVSDVSTRLPRVCPGPDSPQVHIARHSTPPSPVVSAGQSDPLSLVQTLCRLVPARLQYRLAYPGHPSPHSPNTPNLTDFNHLSINYIYQINSIYQ